MKINGSRVVEVMACDIGIGCCFSYKGELFMRMANSGDSAFYNESFVKEGDVASVRLGSGHPAKFSRSTMVHSVDAEVTIK